MPYDLKDRDGTFNLTQTTRKTIGDTTSGLQSPSKTQISSDRISGYYFRRYSSDMIPGVLLQEEKICTLSWHLRIFLNLVP